MFYTTIENFIEDVSKTNNLELTIDNFNSVIYQKYKYSKIKSKEGLQWNSQDLIKFKFWEYIKATFEGNCIKEGLVLKSDEYFQPEIAFQELKIVPEYLNGYFVSKVDYKLKVFAPKIDNVLLARVNNTCNLGVIAFLVPFVSMDEMNASKKHYPNTFDKEWKMIESEKYIKSINSQFRVNPCKILLPYQLHTEFESIDNLKNDDLILLRIKGIKGINSNNNMNVVGIYEKMFIDKTNFVQWKFEQENPSLKELNM